MGPSATRNVSVRGASGAPIVAALLCPECSTANLASATRCVFCHAELPSKAPARAPRTATPIVLPTRADFDSLFGELEALARDDAPAVQFQCPACGRFVDETAARCACGAIFEEPGAVGYACPICGMRVAADASACPCGARFSD